MLYILMHEYAGLGLFRYISFRGAMAVLTGFGLALLMGGPVIAWLESHRIREDVSKSASDALVIHSRAAGKMGTPTMGGSFLVAALLCTTLLWCRLDNVHVILGLVLVAGLGAVGFVDDFLKLTVRGSDGLSEKSKLLGQLVVAGLVVAAMAWTAHVSGRYNLLAMHPPFFKGWSIDLGHDVFGMGIFVIVGWLVVAGTANAVNITDGLDGLAAGCTMIAGGALAVFCYVMGRWDWTDYLGLTYVPEAAEMSVMGGALVGSCAGFLWFNAFPARVFMGDSGSLPLGGLLGWMALVSKQELVLPLIALVPFAELGSTALQRVYFKLSGGKRIFTIAPLHHAFNLKGGLFRPSPTGAIHEVTVVVRLWLVAALAALTSLALLKVR
jgi:phospho-N-acetylmuramoyl-pentapeptide-transferase